MKDDLLIEEPQDVIDVLSFIKSRITGDEELIKFLEGLVDSARSTVLVNYGVNSMAWESWFLTLGNVSWKLLKSMTPFDESVFAKFLLSKHIRYRLKPLLVWGELGILIRLQSKVGRLVNITSNVDLESKDEPPEKTVEDILGYCILGYLLTKKLKEGKTE